MNHEDFTYCWYSIKAVKILSLTAKGCALIESTNPSSAIIPSLPSSISLRYFSADFVVLSSVDEIKEVFSDVTRKGKLIIAKK